MATRFNAEQMKEIRRAAGVEDPVAEKSRETFAVATTEIPASTETQPVSVDEIGRKSHHAAVLQAGELKEQIAAMGNAAAPVERVLRPKDAQALDVSAIHEELDRRDVGLAGRLFDRVKQFFTKRSS